ncbi:protein shisa-like-2B [Lampetra planeri]
MMGEHAEGSHVCTAYETATHDSMSAFLCPRTGDPSEWTYCCGFSDNKHCCETPDQYFPYRGGYMWSLSVGALVGLGIAGLILIAFVLCAFVLCYFSLFTKPAQRLPSGLRLQPLGKDEPDRPALGAYADLSPAPHARGNVSSPTTQHLTCETPLTSESRPEALRTLPGSSVQSPPG